MNLRWLLFIPLGLTLAVIVVTQANRSINLIGDCLEEATTNINDDLAQLLEQSIPKAELCTNGAAQLASLKECYATASRKTYFPAALTEAYLHSLNSRFPKLQNSIDNHNRICADFPKTVLSQ
jgi:hypothetical protein